MRFAIILILFAAKALSAPLALDYIGEGQAWMLDRASKSPSEAKTLELYHGRKNPWVVYKSDHNLVKHEPQKAKQFLGYQVVSESSPVRVINDPSQRIYNLPDLLDRLELQGRTPEGITLLSGAEGDMKILVTRRTVLSASFSVGKKITILNRSDLVLILPYASSIRLEQGTNASSRIYSANCIPVIGGEFQRASLDGYYLGNSYETKECQGDKPYKFEHKLESWMPQLLISAKLRKESLASMFHIWHQFIFSGA